MGYLTLTLTLALHVAGAEAAVAAGWSLQQSPNPAGAAISVLAGVSCASPKTCVAVGYSTNPAGAGVTLAEHWNGTGWAIQRTPNPADATSSLLFGVSCASKTACTAVGSVTDRAGTAVPLAERWNGSRWAIQRTPAPARASGSDVSYLGGVSCASTRDCTAVGYSGNSLGTAGMMLVQRWNGTSWATQRPAQPADARASFLSGVSCAQPMSCTATGFFISGADTGVTLAERWNGTDWAIQPTATPTGATYAQLMDVSCASTRSCTAVGFFSDLTGIQVMLAERWNAADWATESTLYPDGARYVQLLGVSCASPRTCSAVGFFNNPTGLDVTLAERRVGTTWVIQPTPNPAGATTDSLEGVSCPSKSACVAVGELTNGVGTGMTLAERYSINQPGRARRPRPRRLLGLGAGG